MTCQIVTVTLTSMNTKTKIPFLCTCSFIGITSFITATVFFSWYYHIANLNPSQMTDLVAEPVVYLIHAVGMLLFSLFLKRKSRKILDRTSYLILLFAWFIFSFLSVLTKVVPLVYAFGLLASLFAGFLFAYYLTALAGLIPKERRGLVFGVAGFCSSVGTYLISLPMNGTFLTTKAVWFLYAVLTLCAGWLGIMVLASLREAESNSGEEETAPTDKKESIGSQTGNLLRTVIVCGLAITVANLVLNIGFGLSSEDVVRYGLNPEYSRAFYSVGLLVAGIIHDKSRKTGIMISAITLILPFVSWLLLDNMIGALAVWIVGYILQGFFNISRILLFADPAGEDRRILYLAPFGYVFGRIGEMSGILVGTATSNHPTIRLCITFAFFAAALILWFLMYDRLFSHKSVAFAESVPKNDTDASSQTELSPRESEVLDMLLQGLTLKEIAGNLYISENTVKFHVKNIYRKTDCNNRKELLQRYRK